jgi:gas vesicle protein
MSTEKKIIVALLGGLAVGALLGMLFAPGKGSDSRQKITHSIKKMAEKPKKRKESEPENPGPTIINPD